MKIKHGQTLETLVEVEVTHANFDEVTDSSPIIVLAKVLNHEIDVNGNFQIPHGVTHIGDGAIAGCSSLLTVDIPEGVTHIGDEAFAECSSLLTVEIPEGVTHIGELAFYECTSLVIANIPEGVRHIGNDAFAQCKSLSTVVIPKGVTYFGKRSFKHCTNLLTVKISKDVPRVGVFAFNGCSRLQTLEIHKGLTTTPSDAFSNCSDLLRVEIPEGLTDINMNAFYGSRNIKNIIIDSENINEIERVRLLFTDGLGLKVVMKPFYEKANGLYQNAKARLARLPEFNSLYKWNDYLAELPNELLHEINDYQTDNEKQCLFRKAIQEIDALKTPKKRGGSEHL